MKIGDKIEVIDTCLMAFPVRGKILDIDEHPFGESSALVRIESAALPAPEVWVNLRLAKLIP